ncbi:MAG TPA: NAD(P)/FAD-dependent oxidoreductase [Dermatophilaceae bacterium]|nr:NAD(P)/FAD-dependent oxidoreductase [Dermatophilaceae bacterium]
MADVVIVGGRLAGSATAMLLARAGLDVLVLEQASFPCDTLSSHQLQVTGSALIARWGLLDRLEATGAPPTRLMRFDAGPRTAVWGRVTAVDGVDAMYSPRRTVLDTLLVDAAREAGAKVREGAIVEELTTEGSTVTGVRLRLKGGGRAVERASLVIGADGKNSTVARAVGARTVREAVPTTLATYAYWSGVPLDHGWMASGRRLVFGAFPTNDDQVVTFLARPVEALADHRADAQEALAASLRTLREIGERVLSGQRVGPIRATVDVPNRVLASAGPGWVLVGDAGLVMDPVTGQGMGNALADAAALSDAVLRGFAGTTRLGTALRRYERQRNRARRPMFDFTVGLAQLRPPTAAEGRLFAAVADDPAASEQFLAALAGVLPMDEFMSPANIVRLVGLRGLAQLARSRPRRPRPAARVRRSGLGVAMRVPGRSQVR